MHQRGTYRLYNGVSVLPYHRQYRVAVPENWKHTTICVGGCRSNHAIDMYLQFMSLLGQLKLKQDLIPLLRCRRVDGSH